MGTEEVSKLWSAFQSRYRPSAPYVASVVLIEAKRPTRAPLPVRERKLYVAPFREPVIERVLAEDAGSPPVRVGPPILARHRLRPARPSTQGRSTIVSIAGLPAPG